MKNAFTTLRWKSSTSTGILYGGQLTSEARDGGHTVNHPFSTTIMQWLNARQKINKLLAQDKETAKNGNNHRINFQELIPSCMYKNGFSLILEV
jgi:hypothetical protein